MPILSWDKREVNFAAAGHSLLLAGKGRFGDAKGVVGGGAMSGNLLVQGDNLLAMKALMPYFRGRVQCVFIDPPFNTGKDFPHYDDSMQHTQWLEFMHPRLTLMRNMLSEDGSVWVAIDIREMPYLKVMMDEIFGRKNFVNLITNTTAPSGFKTTADNIFTGANYLCVYAKKKDRFNEHFKTRKIYVARDFDAAYSKFLENPDAHYSKWKWCSLKDKFAEHLGYKDAREAMKEIKKLFGDVAESAFEKPLAKFALANAKQVFRTAAFTGGARTRRQQTIDKSARERNKVFVHPGEDQNYHILGGERMIFYDKTLVDIDGQKVPGRILTDVWTDISWTGIAGEGGVQLNNGKKPEKLVRRILQLATDPGDLVLDSFLGSGTTAAVAHKMGRRWIGIESGKQAKTHCIPRLQSVIDGEQSGISESENWEGGGGFYFMKPGPLIFDESGNVHPELGFTALAAYVWFWETQTPLPSARNKSPFLGEMRGVGYALLYNGILKDKTANGGNALTNQTLQLIRAAAPKGFDGKVVVYGIRNCLQAKRLKSENLEFRQIPFDLKLRNDNV